MVGSPSGQELGVAKPRAVNGLKVHWTPAAGANKAGGPKEDTQPTARVEMGMRRWLGNTDGAHLTGVTHAVATRVPTGRPYQCLRHITSDISVAHAP